MNLPNHWKNWANVALVEKCTEVFDILPVAETLSARYLIPMSSSHANTDVPPSISFVQARQHTRYAVLPIHTSEERSLFRTLVAASFENVPTNNISWTEVAKQWNAQSSIDGKNIFYKYPEYLRSWHRKWVEYENRKKNLERTKEIRQQCLQNIPRGSDTSAIAPSPRPLPSISQDQLPQPNTSIVEKPAKSKLRNLQPAPDLSYSQAVYHTPVRYFPSTTNMAYSHPTPPPPAHIPPKRTSSTPIDCLSSESSQKRARTTSSSTKPKRKAPTCTKCFSTDCPGRRNRNACRLLQTPQ